MGARETRGYQDIVVEEDQQLTCRLFCPQISGGCRAARRMSKHFDFEGCCGRELVDCIFGAISAVISNNDHFHPIRGIILTIQCGKDSTKKITPVMGGNNDTDFTKRSHFFSSRSTGFIDGCHLWNR
jgi:hypothetical protein